MNLYECHAVSHVFQQGAERTQALQAVTLNLPAAKLTCLAGPSGSGKSTLLALLGLIEPVSEGSILYRGRDIRHLSGSESNRIRREELGFVFQTYYLLEALSVLENVEYFLARQGVARMRRRARALEALAAVGLSDKASRRPSELSGGQRQRVAIARALAKEPKVILADEPTASLDQTTGRAIMELLASARKDRGVTIVMASHDPMAMSFADEVVRLAYGRLVNGTEAHVDQPDRSA